MVARIGISKRIALAYIDVIALARNMPNIAINAKSNPKERLHF